MPKSLLPYMAPNDFLHKTQHFPTHARVLEIFISAEFAFSLSTHLMIQLALVELNLVQPVSRFYVPYSITVDVRICVFVYTIVDNNSKTTTITYFTTNCITVTYIFTIYLAVRNEVQFIILLD